DRGTVLGDEDFVFARTVEVQRACDQLLSGAALSLDEHRDVARGHALEQVEDLLDRRRSADDAGVARSFADDGLESPILFFELGAAPDVLEREGRMVGERFDEAQVVARERLTLAAAVEVDGADDPAARAQRNAHERSNPEEADATEIFEAVVLAGV